VQPGGLSTSSTSRGQGGGAVAEAGDAERPQGGASSSAPVGARWVRNRACAWWRV
jgi:hypothetical protein